jgi:hypothetical protein
MMGNTMTVTWRQRKLRICRPRAGLVGRPRAGLVCCLRAGLVLAAALAVGLGLAGPIGAATTEQIVVDRNSGLAISGFDPVAYFTDAQALQGKGEFEQVVAGAAWRFRSEGNSAAFKADPEVYMPRFGGYDPVDIARGVAVPGNPRLWVISGERLYLFYSTETKEEFAADRDRVITAADRTWPSVSHALVP